MRRCDGPDTGVLLVSEEGRSRYLENGLWTSLKNQFREPTELLDDSSNEEDPLYNQISTASPFSDVPDLLLGSQSQAAGLRALHPEPAQIFKLWQLYLDNINPIVKVFHAPTIQKLVSAAASNLSGIPRDAEALMFAIYCVTIQSLSNEDCITVMGEFKDVLKQRYRSGAQYALLNANYLRTSNIMVLQAFTLLVVSPF